MENLSRLAAKPGVQSTLILSKADGSIIRSSGLLADPPSDVLITGDPRSSAGISGGIDGIDDVVGEGLSSKEDIGTHEDRGTKTADEVAKMVFSLVQGARECVEGMDKGDEVKLLRLRTRKNEIVIVPG